MPLNGAELLTPSVNYEYYVTTDYIFRLNEAILKSIPDTSSC